jgi:hypothetical protein
MLGKSSLLLVKLRVLNFSSAGLWFKQTIFLRVLKYYVYYKWLNQVFYILQVFNDPTALTEDDLYDLRNRWATCFLDLYHPENDYDDVAEEGS